MLRMKKILLAAIIVFASAGTASAGGQPGSIGVGAEFQLSGLGGLSANYDAGRFHVGGFFGVEDPTGPNNTTIDVGGRFFFHVASTASSDFGVGGSLGIESTHDMAGNSVNDVFIEPSFQIRAFVATNVALSFTAGISIGAADAGGLEISGGSGGLFTTAVTGQAGVHYYF